MAMEEGISKKEKEHEAQASRNNLPKNSEYAKQQLGEVRSYCQLTNYEKGCIRKCRAGTYDMVCKRYNITLATAKKLLKGKLNSGQIYQVFADGNRVLWSSMKELVSYGYSRVRIMDCLNGKSEFYAKSKWLWKYRKNTKFKKEKIKVKNAKCMGRRILQYDMDMNFIKEFRTVTDASIECGVSQGNISNCLRGRKCFKSTKGFKWKYKK
jgi:hypothetical protein